ncbi:MAG: hypothetical protein KJ077_19255 [Anaerolineae bacterium]|nr:hypothetical protein [Anaerolineae bacterium]
MTAEPAKPEKQLTPQTERVLQNSILVLREARHPLTSIVGFSEVMLKSEDSTDSLSKKRKKYLTVIQQNGNAVIEIFNFLHDIFRLVYGELSLYIEEVDLRQLIGQVISATQVKVEQNLPHYLPKIWADQGRIQQVLKWILSEAQGAIYLGEADSILLTLNGDDDWVTLSITASGSERLFYFGDPNDPVFFFSRSIIEMHGGQLHVNVQEELKRLEISFTLPTRQDKPVSST